jgi:hypothetical protein
MSILDQLPRASFDGIEFPVKRIEVIGGLRDHVHEYPHSPGGAPEKLGRKLYTFRFATLFDARGLRYGENLYPGALAELRDRFEEGLTADLHVPNIGTIPAYCFNWSQVLEATLRSGETADLEFREDQASAFLFEGLVNVNTTGLAAALENFNVQLQPFFDGGTMAPTGAIIPPPATAEVPPRAMTKAEALAQLRQRDVTALESIRAGFVQATSLLDQGELYVGLVQAKAEAVIQGCSRAYETIEFFKNPLAWRQVQGFKQLWAATQELYTTSSGRANRTLLYTVPATMGVGDISRLIYGDAERAVLILRLNAFPDAFQIQAGTVVRYFDPATLRGVSATAQ